MSKTTTLPKVEEMLLIASNRSGRPVDDIKADISKYSEGWAILVRKNEKLMTYLYIKRELGIDIKLAAIAPEEPQSIKEMLATQAKSKLSTEGYLVRLWNFVSRKGKPAIGFIVADKTASMHGRVYFDDAREKFEEAALKEKDFVRLGNVSVNEWNKKREIRIWGSSVIDKLTDKDVPYPYEELVTSLEKLQQGIPAVVQVTLLTVDDRPYIGCPECRRKIDDTEAGDKGLCPGDKEKNGEGSHGEVIAVEYHFVDALATDGTADVTASFNPRIIEEIGGVDFLQEGLFYEMFGSPWESTFSVEHVKALESGEIVGEAIATRIEKGVTKNVVAEKIPVLVDSWGSMPKEKLVQNCKNLMGASDDDVEEAIRVCLENGSIVEEKGVFMIKKKEVK